MVLRFTDKYRFLSNFFEVSIYYDGLVFRSAENAYQASKTDSRAIQESFQDIDPREAKKRGRHLVLRDGWDAARLDYMSEIVHAKFTQHKDLRRRLLATGIEELIEGNTWHDNFYGVCECGGEKPGCDAGHAQNWLGRILVAERIYWRMLYEESS